MGRTLTDKPVINIGVRVNVVLGCLAFIFFIVAIRLWYLQILRGDVYRIKSENNRIRTVYVPPPRGLITDRHGKVLVRNRPAFNIEFVTEDAKNPKEVIQEVANITATNADQIQDRLKKNLKRRRFEPKVLLKDVSRDIVAKVSAQRYRLPGVVINVDPAREYIYGDLAAHVIGYIREITSRQLENPAYGNYRFGDMVGQFGIEQRLERFLQGQRGVQYVIVDAMGNRIGESSFQQEKAGSNVTLTLDYDMQQAADNAMAKLSGSVVAMDVNTGEILALSSNPRFDPNIFAGEVTTETWNELVSGPEKRMNNRAIQGAFPPGSVFKIFMAAAALSEGVVRKDERVFCPGFMPFGGRNFRCHKHSGHGSVNLEEAMVQSCDVYFYTVGNRLGIDRIADYANRFGLGFPTGLELVDENKGIIPSTKWKRENFRDPENKKWYPGETLSVAIGQGAVTTTPLQIVRAVAASVNGGYLLKPYLVERITAADGHILEDHPQSDQKLPIGISQDILNEVRKTMEGVVNDKRGTGRRAQLPEAWNIKVGGKTGTAQVVGGAFHKAGSKFDDHAWFAGYAPTDKPKIAVVALVENGGHGGATSAPIVRQVMEAYFAKGQPLPATTGADKNQKDQADQSEITD